MKDITLCTLHWPPDEESFIVQNDSPMKGYRISREAIESSLERMNRKGVYGEMGQIHLTDTSLRAEGDVLPRFMRINPARAAVSWSNLRLQRVDDASPDTYVVVADGTYLNAMHNDTKPVMRALIRNDSSKHILTIVTWDLGPKEGE